MSDEYTELERLAKEATPGPWVLWVSGEHIPAIGTKILKNDVLSAVLRSDELASLASSPATLKFIAACSPEVVLKLIQKTRVQTQLVEALEWLIRNELPSSVSPTSFYGWENAVDALAAAKETM